FAWWPIEPTGFLLCFTFGVGRVWFSLLLGWAVKVLCVYLLGGRALEKLRPFFLGMIVGEALATVFWTLLAAGLAAADQDFHPIVVTP
ncbi:MAG TPA: hypothetical protein PKB10_09760, partial [Tepidisphaeraceae bacterium]|nr:hypothetical protein [Tepidisphaeraceae bacterium]